MVVSYRLAVAAAAIRDGLLRVHDSRRGGEEREAEGEEQQYLLHGNLPSVSATGAGAIREGLIGVGDNRHHRHAGGESEGQDENCENLFHDRLPQRRSRCQKRVGVSVTAITFWGFFMPVTCIEQALNMTRKTIVDSTLFYCCPGSSRGEVAAQFSGIRSQI
jgi:hypothetical protein